MELADIPQLVQELQGREISVGDPRYPGVLAELGPEDFKRFGEKISHRHARLPDGKAPFLSTSCRTTSGTWASSI
jgi:hypothetical protein